MAKIKIYRDRENNGFYNMALDEAIFRKAIDEKSRDVILRFYDWDPACLSLGYFQSLKEKIDEKQCDELGIDVVRRPTGGRAVLHDRELTYSVIAPTDKLGNTTLSAYLNISKGLNRGLNILGVKSEISPPKKAKRKGSTACFDSISSHEISVEGKKIVGSAQYRDQGYLLQHGSILIDLDVDKLYRCLKSRADERIKKYFKKVTTSINDELNKTITKDEIEKAMIDGFAGYFDFDIYKSGYSEELKKRANKLLNEKYNTKEWNYLK
ncbi:MAG: lipoate--protein ligase family protein [Candidatus Mcinerneyibacterium aminivorans]|uniref:Lipoate--protein ligase family protein n=1 Tax=Candidatus Mcinerneyibacterium aminivorans TaxID=2703815 RepID=A0A5D0MEX4_9BACT|nr:MAG: lipoate--protein ligase family protein [Candidatus Mcinerneyibacterium aminivorans]